MGTVFGYPPAEAHPDQGISDCQPEQPVSPAGPKDLLVPCVMADEAQLGEHHGQECCDNRAWPTSCPRLATPPIRRRRRRWSGRSSRCNSPVGGREGRRRGSGLPVAQEVAGRPVDGGRLHEFSPPNPSESATRVWNNAESQSSPWITSSYSSGQTRHHKGLPKIGYSESSARSTLSATNTVVVARGPKSTAESARVRRSEGSRFPALNMPCSSGRSRGPG